MLSRYEETYHGNEFTRNSSGNARPQSSQLTEPLWSDPGLKIRTGVRELISILKEKKKERKGAGREWVAEPSLQNLACEEISIATTARTCATLFPHHSRFHQSRVHTF